MADWLTQLRTDLLMISKGAARKHWPGLSSESDPYYNYRFEHVQQVERDAQRLMVVVGGDAEIRLASVWIHDRFQPQYEGEHHALRAAEWAHEYLASMGFPVNKVAAVEYAVANHSNAPNTIPERKLEARILWDADKLSKVGGLAIVSFLCGVPAFPQTPASYEWVSRQLTREIAETEGLAEKFYFEQSREWGRARIMAQKAFCTALGEEIGV